LWVLAVACASPRSGTKTTVPAKSPPGGRGAIPAALGSPAPAPLTPPVLRIGLASDQAEFVLPARGTPWTLVSGADTLLLGGPLAIRPVGGAPISRVQVGAFSEENSAKPIAEKMSAQTGLASSVVFSAEKGLFLVRLGEFSDPAAAAAAAQKLSAAGSPSFVVTEASPASALSVRDGSAVARTLSGGTVEIAPSDASSFVEVRGKTYRGRLRVILSRRGLLNVVNLVNLEDYLRGVVPAEMGPRRFDEIEALKAQAVAARTYALASRGGFEPDGYDLCATPKCQAYSGVDAEDPLSDAAVDQTRGLVVVSGGKLIHALFASTCGGHTENVENIFPSMSDPALRGVPCGEQDKSVLVGAPRPRREKSSSLSLLEWRGEMLSRAAGARHRPAGRREVWSLGLEMAGYPEAPSPPAGLSAAAACSAVVSAFHLGQARDLETTDLDRSYDAGPPDVLARLPFTFRAGYETFLRLKVAGGATLPPPEAKLSQLEFAGLLLSAAVRLGGVQEISGRFARRDGGHLLVKTPSGTLTLEADPSLWLARDVAGRFWPASEIALRSGDPVMFWKRGSKVIGFAVEYQPSGATFENQSSWTEWVRRVSAKELMLRIAARTSGSEVRGIEVTRRSSTSRVLAAVITTDRARLALSGFELRQALELPELIFTVSKAAAPDGSPEFVFVGRGWGHGVGLCQNGAYGMALAGAKYDEILRHYYSGIDIAPFGPGM
ncbi:MAG: SpoIID/LytB domain-containing protein, partial [Thermoanaerobaculia bacterium]